MRTTTAIPADLRPFLVDHRPGLFTAEYGRKSTNMITPDVVAYFCKPGICAAELATGDAFLSSGTLYGVSVAVRDPGTPKGTKREGGKCCHSLSDAWDTLREALNLAPKPTDAEAQA